MKSIGLLASLFIFCNIVFGQSEDISLKNGVVFSISKTEIDALKSAPRADFDQNNLNGIPLKLSMPSGNVHTYYFLKNQVMSREMMDLHPNIVTFNGYATTAKHHTVSLTLMDDKIHGFILGENEKAVYIDQIQGDQFKSYYVDVVEGYTCDTDHSGFRPFMPSGARTSTNGATLKNYDFGVVITDEYEAANGGGAAAIAVAIATINDIAVIYKRDLAVTFTATIRPETSAFDIIPSSVNNVYAGTCVTAYFSQNEYDVGHVFHNLGGTFGGSGVASVAVVCSNSGGSSLFKGRGWSAHGSNIGSGFMSVVAHEMGHMFSATHTFNSQSGFCNQGFSATNSFEPGSGTTLMAYPGVCAPDNITDQSGSNILNVSHYFHVRSLEQMVSYITSTAGNNCASGTATNNSPPVAIANPCNASNITIPANTPFELTGSHTDSDGDAVTFNWEQYDPGPPHGAPNVACGGTTGPIFRSYQPTTSPTRYFPSLTYILNNANAPLATVGECLPTVDRTLNFRLTVRDNNPNGGGIDVSALQLTVSSTTGPLAVTAPNTNETWSAGSSNTVSWSGFNTSAICNTVHIKLSVDGGQTFPFTLISNTTNDGSQSFTLPSNIPESTNARIKVESSCLSCVKFFDISNVNFTVTSSCMAKGSSICPSSALTLPEGDPLLNLGLSPAYGVAITSKVLTTSGANVSSSFNTNPQPGPGTCISGNFGHKQTSIKFKISTPGIYTFNLSNFGFFSAYNGTYTPGSPCTNYLGSTAYDSDGNPGGTASFGTTMTLNLTNICGDYTGVLFRAEGTFITVSINGPAGAIIYENGSPPSAEYNYTYAAVNVNTNTITAVNNTSNFTSLGAGNYCVYGKLYQYTRSIKLAWTVIFTAIFIW